MSLQAGRRWPMTDEILCVLRPDLPLRKVALLAALLNIMGKPSFPLAACLWGPPKPPPGSTGKSHHFWHVHPHWPGRLDSQLSPKIMELTCDIALFDTQYHTSNALAISTFKDEGNLYSPVWCCRPRVDNVDIGSVDDTPVLQDILVIGTWPSPCRFGTYHKQNTEWSL